MKLRDVWKTQRGRVAKVAQPAVLSNTLKALVDDDIIILKWSSSAQTAENWGDALSPLLVGELTGRQVIHSGRVANLRRRPVLAAIGSILDNAWERGLLVWGSGFKHPSSTVNRKPAAIHAVRGPLTRDRFRQLGIDCPEVYGDPALLFPRLYQPERRSPSYTMGLVPHYVDSSHPGLTAFRNRADVTVIDVRSGVTEFVDQLTQCVVVAASSLHGIIAAEAYGIPAVWVRFSDSIAGSPFKYHDYYLSTGRKREPVCWTSGSPLTLEGVIARAEEPEISRLDLDGLLEALPFRASG